MAPVLTAAHVLTWPQSWRRGRCQLLRRAPPAGSLCQAAPQLRPVLRLAGPWRVVPLGLSSRQPQAANPLPRCRQATGPDGGAPGCTRSWTVLQWSSRKPARRLCWCKITRWGARQIGFCELACLQCRLEKFPAAAGLPLGAAVPIIPAAKTETAAQKRGPHSGIEDVM